MLHEERGTSNPRRKIGGAVFFHSLPVTYDEASKVTPLMQSVTDAIKTTGQHDPLR